MKFLVGMVLGWIYTMIFGFEFPKAIKSLPPIKKEPPVPVRPAVDDEEFTTETRGEGPAHFLIKIGSFSLLSNLDSKQYESREFSAGDYKWKLKIYPDGYACEKKDDYISVYVAVAETSSLPDHWEVNAHFNICLLNQSLDNYLCFRGKVRRFNKVKSEWGFSKMISKQKLRDRSNGFLVNDSFVFGAEVFVVQSQPVMECVSLLKLYPYKREWKISEFSKLGDVWTSEEFTTGDHKWKILLYVTGEGRQKGQSVGIYLESVNAKSFAAHQKVKAEYCMRLKSKLDASCSSGKLSNWFTSSNTTWGTNALIRIADLRDPVKGFTVDDCCILETEINIQVVV